MNSRHKYFRNLRYKQKLEARYDNNKVGESSGVFFITHEVDPRYIRAHQTCPIAYRYHPELLSKRFQKARGRNYYRYWDRPEVEYSIVKYHYRSGWKRVMKTQTARHNRRLKIDAEDTAVSAKGFYKKVEDRWNYD